MAETQLVDRTFRAIRDSFIASGQAPHYAELAQGLGVTVEEARQALRDLMKTSYPGWVYPNTDYIASCAPFHNMPTPYRVSVEGQPRGYAQRGFEALAVCWLFPGQTVRIDATCLDCGDPLVVEMRDGHLVRVDPTAVVGHLNNPWSVMAQDRAYG